MEHFKYIDIFICLLCHLWQGGRGAGRGGGGEASVAQSKSTRSRRPIERGDRYVLGFAPVPRVLRCQILPVQTTEVRHP